MDQDDLEEFRWAALEERERLIEERVRRAGEVTEDLALGAITEKLLRELGLETVPLDHPALWNPDVRKALSDYYEATSLIGAGPPWFVGEIIEEAKKKLHVAILLAVTTQGGKK